MKESSELHLLRSRLVTSALEERRRIERALHDGLQQDLIAISVQLQLMRDLMATQPEKALSSLDEIQQETRSALDRLRTLASEIYPAILDARGLPDALRQAGSTTRSAARVETVELRRYPAEVEAAVFFLWRAVLGDLGPNSEAWIQVREEDGALQVEIDAGGRVGLTGVRDLIESAGGRITAESEAGGDVVRVRFPLAS